MVATKLKVLITALSACTLALLLVATNAVADGASGAQKLGGAGESDGGTQLRVLLPCPER